MRITTLFAATMIGIPGVGTLVSGGIAITYWQQESAARDAARLTDASAALLRLTERMVIERGNWIVRVGTSMPADEETMRRMEALQRDTDAALVQAWPRCARSVTWAWCP